MAKKKGKLESLRDIAARMVGEAEARIEHYRGCESLAEAVGDRKPLLSILPPDLPPQVLAECSSEQLLADAATRVAECRRCGQRKVDYGSIACLEPSGYELKPGSTVTWDDGFRWRRCGIHRWWEVTQTLKNAGVPNRLLHATIGTFYLNRELQEEMRQYVLHFSVDTADGYQLFGSHGTGKSHLAVAIMRGLLHQRRIRTARFCFIPSLLDQLRNSYDWPGPRREAFRAELETCDLLVLDDLGAERTTDWVREQLGVLINARWSNSRPVLVTANHNLDHYQGVLGERAYSRLIGMVPYARALNHADQRNPVNR